MNRTYLLNFKVMDENTKQDINPKYDKVLRLISLKYIIHVIAFGRDIWVILIYFENTKALKMDQMKAS